MLTVALLAAHTAVCPADYKAGRAGLECRTEEELEEKIAEMEHSIQHDGLTLNVSVTGTNQ
jgi:hypothetical protein